MLEKFFNYPKSNDIDSILACMVGAIRWHGYAVDFELIEEKIKKLSKSPPYNFNSPAVCRLYLEQVMSETEKSVLFMDDKITTRGVILEEITKWTMDEICPTCNGQGCNWCDEGTIHSDTKHPAAERAQEILNFRRGQKELENYIKLVEAGRFHVDLNIIGTRSYRKSGKGGLNAQGIKRIEEVRKVFTLADNGLELDGGDFESFQVAIQEAVYKDPKLREDLLKEHECLDCKGKGCKECKNKGKVKYKIHGLFSMELHPGKSYFDILKTKGTQDDLYDKGKRSVFAISFGGNEETLYRKVGIPRYIGLAAFKRWTQKYIIWGQARQRIFDAFCSMRQPGGIGTKVEWNEPADYIESIFGFRRYFTLENKICKALYDLGESVPKQWESIKLNVVRRDREQTVSGATRSALFAAAFGLQAANMRAAANHEIQSPEASITKMLEIELWKFQPWGINEWQIMPFNMHDEIMCPLNPQISNQVQEIVLQFVENLRPIIPLIEIDWKQNISSWANK